MHIIIAVNYTFHRSLCADKNVI